jgi:alpha-L-fucosidase
MLAPTDQQPYGVMSSPWGKDILAPFVESCKKYNVSICYYIGPNANGYLTQVAKVSPEIFVEKQLNMTKEVLTKYGPVRRLWWDHFDGSCGGLSECPGGFPEAWPRFVDLVREVSPSTIIGTGPDIGHSAGGESGDGSYPRWNACNTSDGTNYTHCASYGPIGYQFKPREADATIQNPGDAWFWHPSHSFWNSSQIWDHFFLTWGRGDAFILNMPPNTTGVIAEEYTAAGAGFGDALRASFGKPLAAASTSTPAPCASAVLEVQVPAGGANAFMTRESMTDNGQRIANYTVETSSDGGSTWTALPPVDETTNLGIHGQTVGYRIVDILADGQSVAAGDHVRVRCTSSIKDPVLFRDFGIYVAKRP